MNRSFVFWSASGALILAVVVAGCQKKDEPVPLGSAPATQTPAGTGSIGAALPANPATSATDEGKTINKEASGEFF